MKLREGKRSPRLPKKEGGNGREDRAHKRRDSASSNTSGSSPNSSPATTPRTHLLSSSPSTSPSPRAAAILPRTGVLQRSATSSPTPSVGWTAVKVSPRTTWDEAGAAVPRRSGSPSGDRRARTRTSIGMRGVAAVESILFSLRPSFSFRSRFSFT